MTLSPKQKARIARQLCSSIAVADVLTREAQNPRGREVASHVKYSKLSTALAFHYGLFRITSAWYDTRRQHVAVIVLLPNGLYTKALLGDLSTTAQKKVKGYVDSMLGKFRPAPIAA